MSSRQTRSAAKLVSLGSKTGENHSKTSNAKHKSNDTDSKEDVSHEVPSSRGDHGAARDHSEAPTKQDFTVSFDDKNVVCERRGRGPNKLIFTHGAGGGIESPATVEFAMGFAKHSALVCFQGTMNLQSRVKSFNAVIDDVKSQALGGRSMGARAAVMARGNQPLILVSYPLVAKTMRDQILLDLDEGDVLFIIGSDDKMCPISELDSVRKKMKADTWLLVVTGMFILRSLLLADRCRC